MHPVADGRGWSVSKEPNDNKRGSTKVGAAERGGTGRSTGGVRAGSLEIGGSASVPDRHNAAVQQSKLARPWL